MKMPVLLAGLVAISAVAPSGWASGIEAVRGKKYKLTKQHGPYMIMVASFKTPPPERRTKEGLTPEQAADELVYELRQVGIPAYTFSQDEVLDEIQTVDRVGRSRAMSYRAKQQQFCVLAGNYASIDKQAKSGQIAHATLEYIEFKFQPKFLTVLDPNFAQSDQTVGSPIKKLASGGILRMTPEKLRKKKGPLAGAFLTLNPLLSPEEVQTETFDPLLFKLNSGNELSLLNNTGKYTLVVASFYGKSSKAHVGMTGLAALRETFQNFEVSDSLDEAADGAWKLASALRQGYFVIDEDPTQPPKRQPFEAWVFHDKFRSVVTVGAWDRPDDPQIAKTRELFQAKFKEHADTKRPFLAAEQLTIPAIVPPGALPSERWIFDPNPQLVEVPRLAG